MLCDVPYTTGGMSDGVRESALLLLELSGKSCRRALLICPLLFFSREIGSSRVEPENTNVSRPDSDYDGDLERKHPGIVTETQYPNKSPRNLSGEGDHRSSENNSRGSNKKQKRGKLDWNLLRPPKAQKRQG
ncbi:hypothetical protein BVC80_1835g238 [Macleaya cordata]|uniref:Uncharacterized protein n=1 Tax=Macleaya cordata TaxID=56857 RepID=A0A200R565_MACCD|nr:hypothetical protein BVC80_1835g238 [Macleaya cordata]